MDPLLGQNEGSAAVVRDQGSGLAVFPGLRIAGAVDETDEVALAVVVEAADLQLGARMGRQGLVDGESQVEVGVLGGRLQPEPDVALGRRRVLGGGIANRLEGAQF